MIPPLRIPMSCCSRKKLGGEGGGSAQQKDYLELMVIVMKYLDEVEIHIIGYKIMHIYIYCNKAI